MKTLRKDNMGFVGYVERRLFSRERFYNLLKENGVKFDLNWQDYSFEQIYSMGVSQLDKVLVDSLLDKSAKKQFKDNALWRALKKHFDLDLAIPYLTGTYTTRAIRKNLITTRGKQIIVQQLNGDTTAPVTAIAIGIGTTAAAAGNTALESESTTNGAARGAATVSTETTTTTEDTARWVKTFNFTGSFAITEEGLFDNNTSGGNMLARQVFSAVNVVNGDSLQITHNVQATTS